MPAVIGALAIIGALGFAFFQAIQPSDEAIAAFVVAFVVALAVSAGAARKQ